VDAIAFEDSFLSSYLGIALFIKHK